MLTSLDTNIEFTFDLSISDEDREWIIATATNTEKYRINKHGVLVVELTPGLMAELAAHVLRPYLRFQHSEGNKIKCYRYVKRKNSQPAKEAGYWQSTNAERIIIDNLLDSIRQLLWNQSIEGVNSTLKSPFINAVIRLLKGLESLELYPKYLPDKKLFNTQFGTYDAVTKQWRDADPDDEISGLHDWLFRTQTMADIERLANELGAKAVHA